jgi:hypothetical protein
MKYAQGRTKLPNYQIYTFRAKNSQQNVNILCRNRNCGEIHTQMAVTKKLTVQHLGV